MRLPSIVLGIVAVASIPPAGAAPLPPSREQHPPFWTTTWGIATPDGKTAYVTGSEGKVEAIDLATGKVVWTFADPGKPLVLIGRRLAVEVAGGDKPNTVRVALLNGMGKQMGQSDPITLPERSVAARGPGMGPGPGLSSTAWSDGNYLFLTWRGRGFGGPGGRGGGGRRGGPGGGGPGGPGGRGMAPSTTVAKIDLRTGKVVMLDPDDAPSPPRPKLPEDLPRGLRGGPRGRGGFAPRVGTNGKYAVSVTLSRDDDSRQATLKRWNLASGKALEPLTLAKDGAVEAFLSADYRTVLVNVREQADQEESPTLWHVFSTATGKEICSFAEQEGSSNMTALGNCILMVIRKTVENAAGSPARPRTLRALDMTTGKFLWEHPLEPLRAPPRTFDRP